MPKSYRCGAIRRAPARRGPPHDRRRRLTARVAAIVLAAGFGRRFDPAGGAGKDGATKVLALVRGVPLVRIVATTALASRASSVTMVSGHARDAVEAAVQGLDVTVVHNADFATGMASSLRAGLASLPTDVDGALVLLADMPFVAARTLDALIARFARVPAGPMDAVVPMFDGRRGNPVLIGRPLFARVQSLRGDEGARHLLSGTGPTIDLYEVDDPGILTDIDTRATLDRWETNDPRFG